jgi:hypothetical protein
MRGWSGLCEEGSVGGVVEVEEEDAGLGEVFGVEKLALSEGKLMLTTLVVGL